MAFTPKEWARLSLSRRRSGGTPNADFRAG
jgi:hypothetical protein